MFHGEDNDDDGDTEMNRVEHDDDADNQQVEVPLVWCEPSVKLVFRMFPKIISHYYYLLSSNIFKKITYKKY
jgi:hypothetical protein